MVEAIFALLVILPPIAAGVLLFMVLNQAIKHWFPDWRFAHTRLYTVVAVIGCLGVFL